MTSVFKYSRVDEYSIANIKNRQLYCRHYEAFNDPFECWCIIKRGFPDPIEEPTRYQECIRIWGYDPGPMPFEDEANLEYFKSMVEAEPSIDALIESARICCFSSTQDNPLLWSHYGDGLRGFCLEFDEQMMRSIEKESLSLIPVTYGDAPPVVDETACAFANDQIDYHEMAIGESEATGDQRWAKDYEIALKDAYNEIRNIYQKALASKPKFWSYEDEVRLIYHSDSPVPQGELLSYPLEALKSVIVGEKMSDPDRVRLTEACGLYADRVDFLIAARNDQEYAINISRLDE